MSYTRRMKVKELFGRLRENIWMVEISIFMFAYSIFVEANDLDADIVYFEGFGTELLAKNVGLLFFLTGVATLISACRKKTSMTMYVITLALTTLAAFGRIGAYTTGEVETEIWSIGLVWVHIIIMQMVLLFRYPVRDNRVVIESILKEDDNFKKDRS